MRIEGLIEQDPANLLWIKEAIEDRASQAEGRMAAFADSEAALLCTCLQLTNNPHPTNMRDDVEAELERRHPGGHLWTAVPATQALDLKQI
jgi:hypothetical protein